MTDRNEALERALGEGIAAIQGNLHTVYEVQVADAVDTGDSAPPPPTGELAAPEDVRDL